MAKSVLLVDPHARFRARAKALLAAAERAVLEAGNGDEATLIAIANHPDAIVVDERLPEGSGLAWLAALRARDVRGPAVLVLRPSAFGEPTNDQRAHLLISTVLRKPVDDESLVDAVDAILGSAVAPTRPSQPPPARRSSRPPGPKPRTRRTISGLQASYAAALPTRLDELADAIEDLRRAPDTAGVYGPSKLIAHRLRGTAGAFGFAAVGECAGKIEDALPKVLDSDREVRAAAWSLIEQSLIDARRLADPGASVISIAEAPSLERFERPVSETKLRISSQPPPSGPSMGKLLMVDDDPRFLELVIELGHRKLLHVIPASDAKEALARAREDPPDAALIDVHLGPTSRSFQLAHQLRALPGCEELPIAFVSAAVELPARIEAAHAGASLYLTKPIDVTMFDSAMQQIFALRRTEQRVAVVLHEDAAERTRVSSFLQKRGWKVRSLGASSELLTSLEEMRPDVVLIDAALSDIAATDVCRALRTSLRWQDLPIAFLAADDEPNARRAAFDAGADDYLVRPSLAELTARIEPRIDRASLGRERAGRDRLTGLMLRGAFLDQLAIRMGEARRHERGLSLCLLDLDHFKSINDRRGHLAGDQVLMGLGKLLSTRFRAEDLRTRWGGEEFMVAFLGEAAGASYLLFTRILDEFSKIAFTGEDGERFHATFSAGIATFPEDGTDVEALVSIADRRLYAAKRRGRNRVVMRA